VVLVFVKYQNLWVAEEMEGIESRDGDSVKHCDRGDKRLGADIAVLVLVNRVLVEAFRAQ
jgi:hypothetical protein